MMLISVINRKALFVVAVCMSAIFLSGCKTEIEDTRFCDGIFGRHMAGVSVDQLIIGWPCLRGKPFSVGGVIDDYHENTFDLYDSHEDYRYKNSSSRVYVRVDEAIATRFRETIKNAPEEGAFISMFAEIEEASEVVVIRAIEVLD